MVKTGVSVGEHTAGTRVAVTPHCSTCCPEQCQQHVAVTLTPWEISICFGPTKLDIWSCLQSVREKTHRRPYLWAPFCHICCLARALVKAETLVLHHGSGGKADGTHHQAPSALPAHARLQTHRTEPKVQRRKVCEWL